MHGKDSPKVKVTKGIGEYKRETNVFIKQTRKAKRAYEKKLAKGIRNNKSSIILYLQTEFKNIDF